MPRLVAIVPFIVALLVLQQACSAAAAAIAMEKIPAARFEFSGPIGERVDANIEGWLLRAPGANPGMLEMFRVRDRKPVPKLVPWAGEFAGKYIISAVQSLRLSKDLRLQEQVASIVAEFIATQAPDGYLGPFPKSERLLKHWDLWGHYHALLALALWHEYSGDASALLAARKAADLVCATYLDTGRRVFDAGDHEMNMAILTGMAMIYRLTGDDRYLRMAREVERDWERAGDYIRAAEAGREFFQSPRPRWESLHDLQGLVELWQITGEARYRDAFIHHWRSIRRWDRRNTGGFSSGEQATGNPFAPTAIETCCTVAWMALTIDYLRLTGDGASAGELEVSTLNAGIGSQHPSGRWWTYSTPMDGSREASAHAIVFQARSGTPELNCCSVNGPRVLGMLGEWAVMSHAKGLVLNWLGAGRFVAPLADGTTVTIISSNDAWRDGETTWSIELPKEKEFSLKVRIPDWAVDPALKLNGAAVEGVVPGAYVNVSRAWKTADRLVFTSRMQVRAQPGARDTEGKVSLYRGPILLAFDQAHNAVDVDQVPEVDLAQLTGSRTLPLSDPVPSRKPPMTPMSLVEIPTTNGKRLRLVDFASAGATGTHYRTWLPARGAPPSPAFTRIPRDGARLAPGPLAFRWLGPRGQDVRYRVEFARDPGFSSPIHVAEITTPSVDLDIAKFTSSEARPNSRIYWRVVTKSANGETITDVPPAWFELDPAAPPQKVPPKLPLGPNGEIIAHSLRANETIEHGKVEREAFTSRTRDGTELNGKDQKVLYEIDWPEDDFSVSLSVLIKQLPKGRIAQAFSAWTGSMDDPLRIVIEEGKIFARVESGSVYSTTGASIEAGRPYTVIATKRDATLTLYLNGQTVGSCTAPIGSNTQSTKCALGGNPLFAGDEHLAARFSDFRLYGRALSDDEIRKITQPR